MYWSILNLNVIVIPNLKTKIILEKVCQVLGRFVLTPTNYHLSTERKQFLQVKADLHSANMSRMTGVIR